MKKHLLLIIFISISSNLLAQSAHSSTLYLKSFHQELLKFKIKNQAYYKESLLSEQPGKISLYYEGVLTQLERSKQKVIKASTFKKDDMLKIAYLQSINELMMTYELEYAKVENLRKYKHRSFEDLENFYVAMQKAEELVFATEKELIKAEIKFAKRFKVRRSVEPEEKELDNLLMANQHKRSLDLLFAKAHHMVDNFVSMIENKEDAELSELELNTLVNDLQENLQELSIQAEAVQENKLSEDLKEETLNYLKRSYKSVKKVLPQVAETFVIARPNSIDTKNARIDLNFFSMDYNRYRKALINEHKDMASEISGVATII